jgi:hypothetical protein
LAVALALSNCRKLELRVIPAAVALVIAFATLILAIAVLGNAYED